MKCPNFISAMNIAANPIRCLLSASLAMYSNRESANLSTADKCLLLLVSLINVISLSKDLKLIN